MTQSQPGILEELPSAARYLFFSLKHDANIESVLKELPGLVDGRRCVVGIGQPLVSALGVNIAGLKTFPCQTGKGIAIPSTQSAVWCWLRGEDRGELVHQTLDLERNLESVLQIDDVIDAFKYADSRDLTGYIDGTENPQGKEANETALLHNAGAGLDGSSFVAVQQWIHDLDTFNTHTEGEQDNIIGRRKSDNEELDAAPDSAHVKRTAQESFEPAAFVVRRSMPWCDADGQGLVFVAFGHSFSAYEALLKRMIGLEDGITDGLFRFTRPVTGSYFWCPPMKGGKLDLSALKAG